MDDNDGDDDHGELRVLVVVVVVVVIGHVVCEFDVTSRLLCWVSGISYSH